MTDRIRMSLETIVTLLIPELTTALAVFARWEYTVSGVIPGPPVLLSGVPVSPLCPFGSLASITLWPGSGGAYAIPEPGSRILVEFHDGTASKPAVCGLDPSSVPTLTTLAGGNAPIARVGDTVTISPAQIVSGALVAGGNPVTGGPVQCTITSGSPKVVSG